MCIPALEISNPEALSYQDKKEKKQKKNKAWHVLGQTFPKGPKYLCGRKLPYGWLSKLWSLLGSLI